MKTIRLAKPIGNCVFCFVFFIRYFVPCIKWMCKIFFSFHVCPRLILSQQISTLTRNTQATIPRWPSLRFQVFVWCIPKSKTCTFVLFYSKVFLLIWFLLKIPSESLLQNWKIMIGILIRTTTYNVTFFNLFVFSLIHCVYLVYSLSVRLSY